GIRDAVVIAHEDASGDKRLIAYFSTKPDATQPEPQTLRTQLGATLPDYMVPAAFVTLDQFPLTQNGKLDRKALPDPDATALATTVYEPPQGPGEQTLADIWAELLEVDRVGRQDSFFALGGHSLLAVRLLSRI